MKRLFFIYSLPRSGSAWLSQFLSQPGCYCYHEPLADGDWEHLRRRMQARPEAVVGAIDTSAYQGPPPQRWGMLRYALRRSIGEIAASSRKLGFDAIDFAGEARRFDQVTTRYQTILHGRLGEIEYLRELWTDITALPFDEERGRYLIEMNIQRDVAAVVARHRCSTSR